MLTEQQIDETNKVEAYNRVIAERFDYVEALQRASGRSRDEEVIPAIVPDTVWTSPFPLDVESFYRDQVAYAAIVNSAFALTRLYRYRQNLRSETAALLEQVEAQIE